MHWAVFSHFLYCFACFQLRELKFSAIGYAKGPGCVTAFWAMRCLESHNPLRVVLKW